MVEKTSGWGKAATILICAVLLIIALCCLIPLWHVLISSFSDGQKLLAHEGVTAAFSWAMPTPCCMWQARCCSAL